ncbi:DUF4423 domain-containing protein [Bdellovibrio bacteriovorus]|uniref:DUF4423 domain-containing protein n=1 Tax=Bdellovibrio bacteriovorus TaxID=959 RepID=UPI0035A62CFB
MNQKQLYPEVASFLKMKVEELRSQRKRPLSLRALSVKCGIPSGRFTDLLHGRRPLSEFYAEKLCVGLKLNPPEQQKLNSLVTTASRKETRRTLDEHELAVMSGWENFAILSLLKTKDVFVRSEQIAERLGITEERAKECLEVLKSLNMISDHAGFYERTASHLTTTFGIPSEAIKNAHEAVLTKSAQVLRATTPEQRYYSSITFPFDMKNLGEAKKMIDEFRKKFSRRMELGTRKEVFNLSIQFFPYTELKGPSHE